MYLGLGVWEVYVLDPSYFCKLCWLVHIYLHVEGRVLDRCDSVRSMITCRSSPFFDFVPLCVEITASYFLFRFVYIGAGTVTTLPIRGPRCLSVSRVNGVCSGKSVYESKAEV